MAGAALFLLPQQVSISRIWGRRRGFFCGWKTVCAKAAIVSSRWAQLLIRGLCRGSTCEVFFPFFGFYSHFLAFCIFYFSSRLQCALDIGVDQDHDSGVSGLNFKLRNSQPPSSHGQPARRADKQTGECVREVYCKQKSYRSRQKLDTP